MPEISRTLPTEQLSIPHETNRKAQTLFVVVPEQVHVRMVEATAVCVERIVLRSTPPETVGTLAVVEITTLITITARKGREAGTIIARDVVPDIAGCSIACPIRFRRKRFPDLVARRCSIPVIPIGYQVILQYRPVVVRRYMPPSRACALS